MSIRFMGTYKHNLDDKLRLTVPSKFRAKLAETVIINASYSNHLELRTDESFDYWLGELENYSKFDGKINDLISSIGASSLDLEIDSAGRIKLSQEQLDKVNIKKEVVFIGAFDHIELWDPQIRLEYEKNIISIENARQALDSAKSK
ncbi:hypothetical protein [Spiroplasma endosymbiont of Labia minor]|uniref:division/cell wall cluster transcriptional repressor MraZ n=1 Tax=Spiroplasma endosymbiont of Labia minor TaxID=3066305 RepID=UPI0030D623AF